MNVSSSVLAVAVALVSVIALSAPAIREMVYLYDSSLQFRLQGVENGRVYVFATNRGVRAGSVNQARLQVVHPVARQPLLFEVDFTPVIVQPGETKQIVILINLDDRKFLDTSFVEHVATKHAFEVSFVLRYLNFASKEPRTAKFTPPLRDVMLAGGTGWHRCIVYNYMSDDWGRPQIWTKFPKVEALMKQCPNYPFGKLESMLVSEAADEGDGLTLKAQPEANPSR